MPRERRAALVAILGLLSLARTDDSSGVAPLDESNEEVADCEAYLQTLDIPAGLPQLSVRYKVGGWGKKVSISGANSKLKGDDVKKRPDVEWGEAKRPDGVKLKFVLLMFGPDEPRRKAADADGSKGPYLHWMGVNCESTGASCYQNVEYEAPDPLPVQPCGANPRGR